MRSRWSDRRARLFSGTAYSAFWTGNSGRSGWATSRVSLPNAKGPKQAATSPPTKAAGAKSGQARSRAKLAPARRRAEIEALEPRILLNADLTGDAAALGAGVQSLETWASALQSHQAFSQSVPVIDRTLGEAVDFGPTVATYLTDKIEDYLDSSTGTLQDATPTGDELAAALSGNFSDAAGDVTVGVTHSGTAGDFVFDVTVTRNVAPAPVAFDLSADDGGHGRYGLRRDRGAAAWHRRAGIFCHAGSYFCHG